VTPANGTTGSLGGLAAGEVHVWRADLDSDAWPGAELLPDEERRRAAAIVPDLRRRRWAASRWALREALAGYLGVGPVAVSLRTGRRGKPALAGDSPLRLSLSHSGALALIAVASGREVGIDVQRHGRRTAAFYAEWTRREAAAKCFGGGLGEPLPPRPLRVAPLDAGAGWAAALATEGEDDPRVRLRELGPTRSDGATAAAGRR
jgi:hypothetical protein